MIIHNPILTGSFTVNGTDVASITSSAASITAINNYTASQNILNGTYTLTSSFAAQTASFTAFTSSVNSFTASQLVLNGTYATTGSNTFKNPQTINSNLTVTGSITASTLVVQTVSSSVIYSSGSNVFGNNIANTQVFTGSMNLTGSLTVVTTGTEFQVNATGVKMGNVSTDTHSITGSLLLTGSMGIGTTNPQEILHISSSSPAIRIGGARTYLLQTVDTDGRFRIHDNTAGERFTIASGSGNIGIGTVIPNSTLHVSKGGATFQVTDTGKTANNTFSVYGLSQTSWAIATGNSGSFSGGEKIVINDNGNIGIGTSSPSYKLDVVALGSPSARVRNGDLGGTATLLLETANNFSGTCQTFIQCVGSVGNGTSMLLFGTAGAVGDATATERLRITSTGASTFKVSSDSVFDTLTLFNTSQTSAGNRLRFQNGYGDLAGIRALQMDNGSLADDGQLELQTAQNASLGTRMTITNAGSIGAPSGTNIYNASDVRLKRNIETITNGLSKINALNPVKFNWIEGFELTEENKDMFGFIAQEVQNAIPEAVENFGGNSIIVGETTVENPLRVNEKFIIPVLVKAIQELNTKFEEYKATHP